jgi:hypothetical protein
VTVISEKDRNAPRLNTWEERLREEMALREADLGPEGKVS